MNESKIKKKFNVFFQKEFLKKYVLFSFKNERFVLKNFSSVFQEKNRVLYGQKPQRLLPLFGASEKENTLSEPLFFNFSFDKGRLKTIVAWFLEKYGQYKTILFLEKLKEFGFGYATLGGLSLGIDDLKIPNQKISLISKAETKVSKDLLDYRNAKITGVERMQRLIYIWNQTNDTLKQEVVKYFETVDLFNPIYMMAFSGARGNMSQVRQLVGMRGLMSDPQGQIIDFPIQSNFREGLTLTEYLISTYGARKGIVDTALRTATAGYLTRRLVDVAQHVIVSKFDCGTMRGIFLFDMKEANKTIYSFQNRLIGRVLAQDIFSLKDKNESLQRQKIASRNQEIDSKLSFAIAKVSKKALVRSPLTCETPRLICQLCYGWSLSQGKLVSVGEAVGVIAAQSIGEPGTQLTMRTFHTGGVFAGGLTDQILAPFDGKIQYFHSIPGSCIRTSLSEIAFFTKMPGSFFVLRKSENQQTVESMVTPTMSENSLFKNQHEWKQRKKKSDFSELYKIPAYAVLFVRNHEFVQKKQVLAQFSTFAKQQLQYGTAEQTLYSSLAGEFYLSSPGFLFSRSFNKFSKTTKNDLKKTILLVEKKSSDSFDLSPVELQNDIFWKVKNWTNIWILSGKVFYNSFDSNSFLQEGDALRKTSVLSRVLWKKTKGWNFYFSSLKSKRKNFFIHRHSTSSSEKYVKKTATMLYLQSIERQQNYSFSNFCSSFFPFSFSKNNWRDAQQTKTLFENSPLFDFRYFKKQKIQKLLQQKILLQSFQNSFFESGSNKKTYCKTLFGCKKEKIFSFLNLWINQSSVFASNETFSKKGMNKFTQNSFMSKPFFSFNHQKVVHQFRFLPLHSFSSNFLHFSKKENSKNKKFLKPKKDVIYSGNFQKFFTFSSGKQKNGLQKNFLFKKQKQAVVENSNRIETKKQSDQKYKSFINFSWKKKKPLKQIFFKYSTFCQTSSFFRVYNFIKKLNSSQKFVNRESLKKNLFSFKNSSSFPKFLSFKKWPTDLLSLSNTMYQPSSVLSLKIENERKEKFLKKINFPKKFRTLFSFALEKKKAFVFFDDDSGLFLNSLLLKKLENAKTFSQLQTLKKNGQKQILSKKILFSFQYDKVRYKKFGYLFSFYDSSKNRFLDNSLRTFTTLKQPNFDGSERVNIGKQRRGISFFGAEGNGNFFGKDFPTFLSYCFPKDYQTSTNGIFTILPFDNLSKQKKFNKYLSFSVKNTFSPFFFVELFSKNQKRKKNFKKYNSQSLQKKVTFLKCKSFDFVSESTRFSSFNSVDVEKRNESSSFSFSNTKCPTEPFCFSFLHSKQNSIELLTENKNFSAPKVSKNLFLNKNDPFHCENSKSITRFPFFFVFQQKVTRGSTIQRKEHSLQKNNQPAKAFPSLFEKMKRNKTKNFHSSLFLVIHALKKKTTKSFFNSELYTEEIFWLPQENYALSILDFVPLSKKTFCFQQNDDANKGCIGKKQNLSQIKNDYTVDMISKKSPLFYFSNRQGKKKPFYPLFEGISSFSHFPNGIKYQHFSFRKTVKKIPLKKFDALQQKVSFYKAQKQLEAFRIPKKQNKKRFKDKIFSLQFMKSQFFFKNFSFFVSFPFCRINKAHHRFLLKTQNIKNKKNPMNFPKKTFMHIEQKLSKDQKTKIPFSTKKKWKQMKKYIFFKEKNRIFFKHSSKEYFSKKFHQSLKKNFCSFLEKQRAYKKLKALKPLFSENFCKESFSTFSNFQTKVGKNFQHQCFSCIPFQKFISFEQNLGTPSLKSLNFHSFKPFVPNEPLSRESKNSSFQSKSNDFYISSQKIQIQIQYGWICFFPHSFALPNWHQTVSNIGHFFGKDLCFEQNKIFIETKVFNLSSFSKEPKHISSKLSFFVVETYTNSIFKKNFLLEKKVGKNLYLFNSERTKTFSFCSSSKNCPADPFQQKVVASSFCGSQPSVYNTDTNLKTRKKRVKTCTPKKTTFTLKSFKKNFNCRFLNNDSLYAFDNFAFSGFSTSQGKEKNFFSDTSSKGIFHSPFSKEIPKTLSFDLAEENKMFDRAKTKKTFALFFRPMQYKLLENPNNYNKLFMNGTLKNSSTIESSISFISSFKIYKKYHSSVLNLQKSEKSFLQNRKNLDATVYSNFQKLNSLNQFQHLFSTHKNVNKFKKNQRFVDFGLSKKETLQKMANYSSKKNLLFKFQNLLTRHFQKNLQNFSSGNKNLCVFSFKDHGEKDPFCFSAVQENSKHKNFHGNYYFSFYPIHFLPLALSNDSLTSSSTAFKNSQVFPTFDFHPLKKKLNFCVCQKKSAFINQRFFSFDFFQKYVEPSSFWLNKDGVRFIFGFYGKKLPYKKNSSSFSKSSSSDSVLFPKKSAQNQSFSFSKSQKSNAKTELFKNFLLKNNHSFYANTKFLSPFEGELLSMSTHETNWWKKASEISTLQKLDSFFSIVTKKDLFSISFSNTKNLKQKGSKRNFLFKEQKGKISTLLTPLQSNGNKNAFLPAQFEYSLKTKQKHLTSLYQVVLKNQKPLKSFDDSSKNIQLKNHLFSFQNGTEEKSFFAARRKQNLQISSFRTKYQNKVYTFKNLKIGYPAVSKNPTLGTFFVYGDCFLDVALRKPGQIVHLNAFKMTLRHSQPFLVSPQGILHLANTPYIQKNVPILTLPYQTVQSGDIVQGIPKVEQLFEARTTVQGRLFLSSLPILLKGIFERYKSILPLEQAVRQSFLKIQQLVVDGVQRVYRSQGVSIVDKHLEVIVRQMTTKVQIVNGAQTGFFPGELVDLNLVERINQFLLVKVRYEPVVLGITRASLEVESFLSASSFQQTTKILALASISKKKDFLKGLKENILVGNLIPSGTGYMVLRKNL
uniref:DNA-directed RNA polymerase subunit beta'' n=1 Tax=Pectinodesmus pectinatus TaxID=91197 RepID=A0A2H4FBR2_9CHLO|nr:RNA polymerase beta'' subunit [Pectinodesmus pectinatus]AOS53053.1 RNA polymerase beta'' subunit [Pectinodesmus pectinatus]